MPALGRPTTDHRVPFQISDAADADLVRSRDAGRDAVGGPVQETPSSTASALPFGPAQLVTAQVLPFQISAKPATVLVVAVAVRFSPTAAQCAGEEHEIPVIGAKLTCLGWPTCWGVNRLPFQVAAIAVHGSDVLEISEPATTHEVSEKQCTAVSSAPAALPGRTAVFSAHFAPFQVQMSWVKPPADRPGLAAVPTATQLLTATQETAASDRRPSALGTGGAATGVSAVPFHVQAAGRVLRSPCRRSRRRPGSRRRPCRTRRSAPCPARPWAP